MVRILACLLAALATTLCRVPLGIGETPVPDVVLVNGRLFTGDGSRPYVEALAIRGDRIVAVGTSANIGSLAGPMTTRIDVGGRVVIPGFNDAHYHLRIEPPLFPLPFKSRDPQWDEVKATVVSAVLQAPKGMLIKGETGAALLDDPRVTRAALDELAPEHPVILSTWTGHSAILIAPRSRCSECRRMNPTRSGAGTCGLRMARSPGSCWSSRNFVFIGG